MKLLDLLKTLDTSVNYSIFYYCNGLEELGLVLLEEEEISKHLDCRVIEISNLDTLNTLCIVIRVCL